MAGKLKPGPNFPGSCYRMLITLEKIYQPWLADEGLDEA
jgi:hypothetical protein